MMLPNAWPGAARRTAGLIYDNQSTLQDGEYAGLILTVILQISAAVCFHGNSSPGTAVLQTGIQPAAARPQQKRKEHAF